MSTLTFITTRTAFRLVRRDNPSTDGLDNTKANQRMDYTLSVSNPIPSGSTRDNKSSILNNGEIPSRGHGVGVMSSHNAVEDRSGVRHSMPSEVYVKWASDSKRLSLLAHEAGLYLNELKPLQGTVVPKFLGFFTDRVKDPKFGMIILELCEGEPVKDIDEFNRLVMVTCCKLHVAGIEHNQLFRPRHLIPCKGLVRVVDFTFAKRHTCANAHPDVKIGSKRNRSTECQELTALENAYGRFSERVVKPRW